MASIVITSYSIHYTKLYETDLEEVYGYDPVPVQLDKENQKLIMGVQANLWTEYIPTAEHLEYMIYSYNFV